VIDYGMRIEVWRKKSYRKKSGNKKNDEKIIEETFWYGGNVIPPFFICDVLPSAGSCKTALFLCRFKPPLFLSIFSRMNPNI